MNKCEYCDNLAFGYYLKDEKRIWVCLEHAELTDEIVYYITLTNLPLDTD